MSDADELRLRLRRQRRESAPVPESEPARAGLPAWVRERMGRRAQGRGPVMPRGAGADDASARRVGAPVELQPVDTGEGSFEARVRRFPAGHRHGAWLLEEARTPRGAGTELALLARDPSLAALDLARAVYLDVETTGLSGGAGTISFLVALGTFEDEGGDESFCLWQGFLPGPEAERAMLAEVARRVRRAGALVSFFGKSFDRHRLEDKMRAHGIDPPFAGLPHLDLYHPLRRYYGGDLPDARLQTMEGALCGVERADDLPGSFAPEAWFDFLAGRAHRLEDVFRHNEDDVLSLVVLAAHLARLRSEARADGAALAGPAGARARGLATLFEERREHEPGLLWSARALERCGSSNRRLAFQRASLLRRAGRDAAACALYEEVARAGRDALAVESWTEVAKLAEHRCRDLERAAAAVGRASSLVRVALSEPARSRVAGQLERRGRRLESKRSKPPGTSSSA